MTPEEFFAIWQRFLHGDENERRAAFESIYHACYPGLSNYADSLLYDHRIRERYYEAQDLVHDVFLVLSKKGAEDFRTPLNDLNGLINYLKGTARYINNNFKRTKIRNDQDLPEREMADQDLIENPFSVFPTESRLLFLHNDTHWRFSKIFNGSFRKNHELCHELLNARYVDGEKYNTLINQKRFNKYSTDALMQVASRNKRSFRYLL